MHPRNFGSEKIYREAYVPTYVHPLMLAGIKFRISSTRMFRHVSVVNRIAFQTFSNKNNKNKADSFFRLNFNVYIVVVDRERARVRVKNKGDQFLPKKNIKIL